MKHRKAILLLLAVLSLTILIIGCSKSNADKAAVSDAYIIPTDIIVDAAPAPQVDNISYGTRP